MTFGSYVRTTREALRCQDRTFSLRQVAMRIEVEPAYLSKIERDRVPPPSENTVRRLAQETECRSGLAAGDGRQSVQ